MMEKLFIRTEIIMYNTDKKIYLILEDGAIFPGKTFGANKEVIGEVVFNTSMTGYQEMLTDPSYAGQILMPTYPMIGNYGINPYDVESNKIPNKKGKFVRYRSDLVWETIPLIKDNFAKNIF